MVLLVLESLKHLDGKSADQVLGDTLEVVISYKFVEIDREELESDDEMLPENVIIVNSDDIILIMWIVIV